MGNKGKVVRGHDKLSAPVIVVSHSELCVGDPVIEDVFNRLGLEYVLTNLWGFDKDHISQESGKFYEIQNIKHRNRKGNVVECERYVGKERLDDDWILNGNPSDEAKMFARQDISYIQDIANLSRGMVSL